MEAELTALDTATVEAEWLRELLMCLHHFLTRVKEGDFCEEKVADLEETKRCAVLELADGVRPMDQRNILRRC